MNGFKKLLILLPAIFVVGHVWSGTGKCKSGKCKLTEKTAFHAVERQWQREALKTIKDAIDVDFAQFKPYSEEGSQVKIGKAISMIERELRTSSSTTPEALASLEISRRQLALLKQKRQKSRALEVSIAEKGEQYKNVISALSQRINSIAQKEQEKAAGCAKTKLYRTTNREFIKAANAAFVKIALLSSYSQKYNVSLMTPSEASDLRLNVISDIFNKFFVVKNIKVEGARYSKSIFGRKIKLIYDDNAVTKIVFKYFKSVFYAKLAKMSKFGSPEANLMKQSARDSIGLASQPDFYSKNSFWCDEYLKLMNLHNDIYPLASQCWADMKFEKMPTRLAKNLDQIESSMTGTEKEVAEALIAGARHAINSQGKNMNTAALTRLHNDVLHIYTYLCTEYKEEKEGKADPSDPRNIALRQERQIAEIDAINNYCKREGTVYLSQAQMPPLAGEKTGEISKLQAQTFKNLAYVESVKAALFKFEMVKFRLNEFSVITQINFAEKKAQISQKRWLFAQTRKDRINAEISKLETYIEAIRKAVESLVQAKKATTDELYKRFFVAPELQNLPESPDFEFQIVAKKPLETFDTRAIADEVRAQLPEILKPSIASVITKLAKRTEARWFWDMLGGELVAFDSIMVDKYLRLMGIGNQSLDKGEAQLIAGWILTHMSTLPAMSSKNMKTWVEEFVKTTMFERLVSAGTPIK